MDILPGFMWAGNSTLLVPSLDYDKRFVYRNSLTDPNSWTFKVWKVDLADGTAHPSQTFNGDPDSVIFSADDNQFAFFKIELSNSPESLNLVNLPGNLYLADLTSGEILETIEDAGIPVDFSPNGKWLAFYKFQGVVPAQTRDVFLVDVATGEILATIEDFISMVWSQDSTHYVYSRASGVKTIKGKPIYELFLGQIGEEPILLGNIEGYPLILHWLDTERFIMTLDDYCWNSGHDEMIMLISLGPPVEVTIITP